MPEFRLLAVRIRHASIRTRSPPDSQPPVKCEVTFCLRGVISPLLANLFLHYALNWWMAKQYRQLPFERFTDDAIVHSRTEMEGQEVRAVIAAFEGMWVGTSSEKTKIVYCKDDDRRGGPRLGMQRDWLFVHTDHRLLRVVRPRSVKRYL